MAEFTPTPPVDAQARDAVRVALAATPRGVSYGSLTAPAAWMAGVQGEVPPRVPQTLELVVFVGHNDIASVKYQGSGLSAFAPEATDEQLAELEAGTGPVAALARQHGVKLTTVNVTKSCGPAGPIYKDQAMGVRTLQEAGALGEEAADRAIESGAELLIPAELGVGATTVAAAIMGVITRTEPVQIVGPGSGTTDDMWKTKVRVVRDAMFRARNFGANPRELIQLIGSPNLAALVAFIVRAASKKVPVLIDGPLVATAALLAERLAEGTREWCLATSIGPEPAQRLALDELSLTPLTQFDMRAGQGLGALTALPLLKTAIELAAAEVQTVAGSINPA